MTKHPTLTIITINYGDPEPLEKTIHSIDRQTTPPDQHIVIASGITKNDIKKLTKNNSSSYREFTFNQDSSLYNAMNIGLKSTTQETLIFINGGDKLIDHDSIANIKKILHPEAIILGRTMQTYDEDCYTRPKIRKIHQLLETPAHQGFIAPTKIAQRFSFDEEKPISADMTWMQNLIRNNPCLISSHIISEFELGGVSNTPSKETISKRYQERGIRNTTKEVAKLILLKILGQKKYYRFIYLFKYKREERPLT